MPAPPPRLRPRLLLATAALAAGLAAAPARAEDAGQWVIGASGGGEALRADQRWRPGLQLGAEARRGLSEAWALRGGLHFGWHPAEDDADAFPPVKTGTAALGVLYAWDVLRVVPYAEAGMVLTLIRGAVSQSSVIAGVQLGGGVDYLLDLQWSLGGVLRYQHLGLGVGADVGPGGAPMQFGLLVRLDRRL
jgi:hypothetical protein